MKPPYLLVPKEIAKSPKEIAEYADILEYSVKNACSSEEFLSRCKDEGLEIAATEAHIHLYKELVRLDKENKNGIWARIIKNNFAPLFIGKVDYVVGNPPWVNWEHLPEGYRQVMRPLWQQYGLFAHKGYKAKLGGGKDDISILLTYVSHDSYLKDSGALGFVITQSVFKTKGGGEGFRSFEYEKNGKTVYLDAIHVDDLSGIQPFEGATNRTAVFVCKKSFKAVTYPVPYVVWHIRPGMGIAPDALLHDVINSIDRQTLAARPINMDQIASPWLTAPAGALSGIEKAIGKSAYRAQAGCCTWLNGVYWLRILERLRSGELFIENLADVGKIKVQRVQTKVERDVVYPLLRGRDVSRWLAEPSAHVIMANRTDKLGGIPESEMRKKFPAAFAYFQRFEDRLRARSGYRQFFQPTDPFYSMYNVGPYTLSSWKVMWPEVGNEVCAGVCGPVNGEIAIADHTIIAVACETRQEAHFIAALLNSAPARVAASGYIVLHPSPHILEHIAIPRFKTESKQHSALAGLSERCHVAAKKDDPRLVKAIETQIDKAAAMLWGITEEELKSIQEALVVTRGTRRDALKEDNGE